MARTVKHSGFIYFLLAEKHNAVKIGFTRGSIEKRLINGITWSPYDFDVLKVIEGTMLDEVALHKRFAQYKIKREWFEYSDELKEFIDNLK